MKKIIKQFLNFGKPYTLGFGKELFLSLLIFGLIGLSSFCSAGSISDYVPGNILFSGSKSFSNAGYTNMFNYGDYGAGTYCLKFTSTSPQTLTMGFANGGTTSPSNLYSLYNDQYGNWICLYGNKPYLNVKLNSSSNTINYEIFNLEQFLNTNTIDYLTFVDYSSQAERTISSDSLIQGYKIYFDGNNVRLMYATNSGPIYFNYNDDNLIEKSQVNIGYCTGNNLCPSCPVCKNKATISFSDMHGVYDTIQVYSGQTIMLDGGEIDGLNQVDDDTYLLDVFIQSPSCDYSGYQSQIDSLSGSLNSCQNSLGASSSSLSSCQNSLNSCLSANCPSVGVSWSSLFINDIQHLGASNIYMTIPEEFDWDYSYSNSGENMEIDIEGYNVDYDYINGVVNVQKYKPSSEDFTQVVGILAPYMKIFLFLLFLFIVIKRLKKPFKSRLK